MNTKVCYIFEEVVINLKFANLQGKKNPGTDRHAVEQFLDHVMNAKEMKIDK